MRQASCVMRHFDSSCARHATRVTVTPTQHGAVGIPPSSTQQSPLTLWPSPKPEGQHCRRRAVYVLFPSPSASGKFSGTLANGAFLSSSTCGPSHSSSGGSANSGALLVVRSRRRSLESFSRNELQIYFPRTSTKLRKALWEAHQRASAKQLAMRT